MFEASRMPKKITGGYNLPLITLMRDRTLKTSVWS